MNRVHKQSPKNLTRENTGSKRIENGPSAPSAQPKASPGAQAAHAPRAKRLPAARPTPACRGPNACLPRAQRPAARLRPTAAPRARARARQRPCACRPARPPARSRPHAYRPARCPAPQHAHARLSRAPSTHAPCRPAPVRPAPSSRLRTPAPAARPVRPSACCLLKWAIAYVRFCTNFFFFIFHFFFHFFQPLENTKKIYLFIFFHFPIHQ